MSQDYLQKVQNYINHYESKGVDLCNNVELGQFKLNSKQEQGIPCLVAKQQIKPGQTIFKVPLNQIISTKTAFFDKELHPIFLENKEFFSVQNRVFEHLVLVTYLIKEECKQEKSEHYNWLQILQENEDSLLYWKNEDIERLSSKKISKFVKFSNNYLEQITKGLIKITQKYPNLFDADIVNRKLIKKYFSLVQTRAFNFGKYIGFVPVADLLNHENYKAMFITDNNLEKDNEYKVIDSDDEQDENEFTKEYFELNQIQKDQKKGFWDNIEKFYEEGKYEAMEEIKKVIKQIKEYCTQILSHQQKYDISRVIFILKLQINLCNKISQFMDLKQEIQEQYSYLFLHDLKDVLTKVQKSVNIDLSENMEQQANIENKSELHLKKEFLSKFKQNEALDIEAKEWEEENFQYLHIYNNKESKNIEKSEQIFASYSLQSNSNLLLNYGFALRKNQFSTFNIPIRMDLPNFQHVKPNIHNTILDDDALKVKQSIDYKLKYRELNTKILEVFRVYNTDLFMTDSIESFGKITNLQLEMSIIDQIGNIYQAFLDSQGYQGEKVYGDNEILDIEFKEQCIQFLRDERCSIVVQQIIYLQEIVQFLLPLIEIQAKDKKKTHKEELMAKIQELSKSVSVAVFPYFSRIVEFIQNLQEEGDKKKEIKEQK